MRLFVLMVLCVVSLCAQNHWYVAVDGKMPDEGGTGTEANPWTLGAALKNPSALIKPGDTLWLRGGVYRGRYASTLSGTMTAPIKVRPVIGERVVLEGFIETFTTTVIPQAAAGSNVNFLISGGGEGFAGNLPNNNMKINVSYTPQGSTTPVEETMLFFGADRNKIWAQRAACSATGGVCPSFPVGTSVRASSEYLKVAGAYTWFMGLEIQLTQSTHVYGTGATNPPWPNFQGAVLDRCVGCKFINNVIRDSGANGIFSSSIGQGTEIYGNLVFYNGVDQLNGRGHGHGVYAQNTLNGPIKLIEDNVFFRSFGHGNQLYGTSSTYLDNFQVIGNTFFNPGEVAGGTRGGQQFVIGDAGVFKGHVFKDNMSYARAGAVIDIGYGGSASAPECMSPVVTGNYLINMLNGLILKITCSTPTITGNTVYGLVSNFSPSSYPSNTYLTSLSGQRVFVRPNRYEAGRANITVFNWSNQDTAVVDVSSVGLVNGEGFEVKDVQDWSGPAVMSGFYGGSPITIPLGGVGVSQPFGTIAVPSIVHTPKEFSVFVIRKTNTTAPTTTPPTEPPPPTSPPCDPKGKKGNNCK